MASVPEWTFETRNVNILGLDALVFGVDDVGACARYFLDYGLQGDSTSASGGRFEGLDGTAVIIKAAADPLLPPRMAGHSMLRETVYGVADAATLDAIEGELRRDRELSLGLRGLRNNELHRPERDRCRQSRDPVGLWRHREHAVHLLPGARGGRFPPHQRRK